MKRLAEKGETSQSHREDVPRGNVVSEADRVRFWVLNWKKKVDLTLWDSKMLRLSLFSRAACEMLVRQADVFARQSGGWKGESPSEYREATVDLEVDKMPKVSSMLRQWGLVGHLSEIFRCFYGQDLLAFDDVFVVRYSANEESGQKQLVGHVDGGDLSFMIALSSQEEYTGGGTWFESQDEVVHLRQGQIVTFPSKTFHKGQVITAGVRYLLVGFCITDSRAAKQPGNVNLDFEFCE